MRFAAAFFALAALTAVSAQDASLGAADLARVKEHARADFERIANFTCQETVRRYVKTKRAPGWRSLDTLRFEVALFGGKELFAPAGAREFHEIDTVALVHKGAVSTGTFSSTVRNLFVHEGGRTTGPAEESLQGRPALRFDFVLSADDSGYIITRGARQLMVGLRGSYWVDAKALDLLRIVQHAADLPEDLQMAAVTTTIDYGRTRIGASNPLLARSADVIVVETNGRQERNVTEFSNCREFGSESVIRFDEPATPAKK